LKAVYCMPNHPLAEVFGFPVDNFSPQAERHRKLRLCPYNNRVANCTKDKANDPLGVCSVFEGEQPAITCPVRFRQDWLIAEDAARFFFPLNTAWTSLAEVRLFDKHGQSAGNIDHVLVAYNDRGHVTDFGGLEVQSVYISGNIRRPFEQYLQDPASNYAMDWTRERNYPRPDYLSSSRKRLAPQLIYKGGIFHHWRKRQAVAIHRGFYETLPALKRADSHQAEMAWLIYDLELDSAQNQYHLKLHEIVYTLFQQALEQITTPEPGSMDEFIAQLQEKLDDKFDNETNPPDAPTLLDLL
jgi:restriction endonuclease NotI